MAVLFFVAISGRKAACKGAADAIQVVFLSIRDTAIDGRPGVPLV